LIWQLEVTEDMVKPSRKSILQMIWLNMAR
jgi:hypothetical protein